MKGMKTPPPSSKSGKKSNSTTPSVVSVEDVCYVPCIFQIRGDEFPVDYCLAPNSIQKRVGSPRIGSYVICTFPNGVSMLSVIWPQPQKQQKATVENVHLHRLWSANVENKTKALSTPSASSKLVALSVKNMDRVRVLPCKQVQCTVEDCHVPFEDLKSSPSFRVLLKEFLRGISVSSGLKLSTTFKGAPVIVTIAKLLGEEPILGRVNEHADAAIDEADKPVAFYRVEDKTLISLVDQTPEEAPEEIAQAVPSSSVSDRSSQDQITESRMIRIRRSFAGYEAPTRLATGLMSLGLGETTLPIESFSAESTDAAILKEEISRRPKGLILCGPPGTGKTQLVHALLDAFQCNVRYLDHSLLLRALEGEAEVMLRQCFDDAQRIAPCCIVMENIDLLCPSRASSTATFLQKRLTSCWLSLMDSLAPGVFVVATTTRVTELDAAVRRAGRMEREIEIGVPSPADRTSILTHLFRRTGVTIADSAAVSTSARSAVENSDGRLPLMVIDRAAVEHAAKSAHGTVGADLVTLVKEIFFQNLNATKTSSTVLTPESLSDDLQQLSLQVSTNETNSAPVIISEVAVANALRRISPSALREVVVEVPSVFWSDIGGMTVVKEALQQVVEWPLRNPEWFSNLHIAPLKGVLLYGPPGCSKTLMAKAVATESSMNFLAVRGPELLSKWLGESEKAVQSLFRRARAAAPAIVFFDEIDALAGVRGDTSSGVSDRVLAQLLTELDGIEALKQVVVIAATNRPDMLDPALIRPGRIDRKIYVPPPDDDSRKSILRLELSKLPLGSPMVDESSSSCDDENVIDLSVLVELTRGFSGAEVVAVSSEAALQALEENADAVSFHHIKAAARKMKPQITEDMLAFYENFHQHNR